MSIFSRLFGGFTERLATASKPRKEKPPANWEQILRTCDFFLANELLGSSMFFRNTLREAATQGRRDVWLGGFLKGEEAFTKNPCFETAVAFIQGSPDAASLLWEGCFAKCCPNLDFDQAKQRGFKPKTSDFDARGIAILMLEQLAPHYHDAALSESLAELCELAGVPFSDAIRLRYDRKVRIYALASLHLAISTTERSHAGVSQIGTALIEITPDVRQHEVEAAMVSLAELCTPKYSRQPSWGKDWLRDVGIDVGNPLTCVKFSYHWALTIETDLKLLKWFAEARRL
jgi:hypothetical protein